MVETQLHVFEAPAWKSFYKRLMDKDNVSLDKIIETVKMNAEISKIERIDGNFHIKWNRENYWLPNISCIKIYRHLMDYVQEICAGNEKIITNTTYNNNFNKISEGVQKIKDKTPLSLEEKKLVYGFFEKLKYSPN